MSDIERLRNSITEIECVVEEWHVLYKGIQDILHYIDRKGDPKSFMVQQIEEKLEELVDAR